MVEKIVIVDGEKYYHSSVVDQLSDEIDDLSDDIDRRGRKIDEAIMHYNKKRFDIKKHWWKLWKS